MLESNARRLHRLALAAAVLPALIGSGEASADTHRIRQLAGSLQFCTVPDPQSPSSAFDVSRSATDANGDYWMAYRCREDCADWRQCQVPAYTRNGRALMEGDTPKQAVAFVVDGMGGHLAYTTRQGGGKTVLLHTGAGGTNYMQSLSGQIEAAADAKVVMVRWEYGFSGWGWFTRTSAPAVRVPDLTRRVAGMIAWVHENLAGPADFGTVGCSMGTQATLGAVYWHDVDPVVDYQLMVGGPGLWDINSGCGRRIYPSGYCDLDASRACSGNAHCARLSARSRCTIPGPIPLAWLYEQVVNHVHATRACDVSAADGGTGIHAPFDESGFAFTAGDWDFDHPIDFQMDLWGSDGDRRWAMGDAMRVFNRITSAAGHEKRWNTTPDSDHCAAIGNGRALQLLMSGMNLGGDPPPPPVARSWVLPLVLPDSNSVRKGLVRVVNRSDRAGVVTIHATDDAGRRAGPVSLSLDAKAAVHLDSRDLERGNAAKRLSGGVGSGAGHWRLELNTDLDLDALAYVRTADGVITSVHESAEEEEAGSMRYRVPIFNPASNRTRQSRLRLINPGNDDARITITGRDDAGGSPGSGVRLTLAAGAARWLTAEQLEQGGADFDGHIGDGAGKWRLTVSADRPIRVMSLLQGPAGNLANLSGPGPEPEVAMEQGFPSGGRLRTLHTAPGPARTIDDRSVTGIM